MARSTAVSIRRRAWLPLALTFVFAWWYRSTLDNSQKSPQWDVVDFKIRDYQAEEQHGLSHNDPRFEKQIPQQLSPAKNPPKQRIKTSHEDLSYDEQQDRVREFIQWDRPNTDHWPAWHDYDNQDYDPNRWEAMDREYGYFYNNTVQELEHRKLTPKPYLPYPDYNGEEWRKEWFGQYKPCRGPRGETYGEPGSMDYVVQAYEASAQDFPAEVVGSAKELELDSSVCFDRQSRYGPYGLVESSAESANVDQSHLSKHLKWENVRWGALQEECFERNMDRFEPAARVPMERRPSRAMKQSSLLDEEKPLTSGKKYQSRTAILIRTWEGYQYRENDIQAIRALVTETALLSGGEYQVFLFVNIKQRDANIYEDYEVYNDLLRRNVPRELRDIAVLWTEKVCEEWYPNVGDWQVYWMQFMPVQWFSKQHPEFDYIWNWETDARYIGNHYHFFEQIANFARKIPRKHLWERNSRFFFPGSWDNNYEAFLQDTDEKILNATAEGVFGDEGPVWGPRPYAPFQFPLGPTPPTSQEDDDFQWGVGEDADFITLQPIWDPSETLWSYRNHIWNYIPEVRPQFSLENGNADGFNHPGFPTIPRRVFINTVVRFSKRMLHVMHLENLQGRSMQAEMWAGTVALQHGLKAVYAPHPIWSDRKWPAWYAEAAFNADDGVPARWGQQIDSPYNHDREANFGGWSWYYRSVFPHILFRRWLGWKAKDWGWDADIAKQTEAQDRMELGIRLGLTQEETETSDGWSKLKMCIPGMLLHPVKNVYEGADGG